MFNLKDDHLEKKIEKLALEIESLDREEKRLLDELKVTPDQLTTFIENPENFSEDNWKALQEHRKKLDEKLLREIANIRNLSKTKKAFAERRDVGKNWMFIK